MKIIKADFIKKISALTCLIIFSLLFLKINSKANETTVYIAGNPNLYPIEYYNDSKKQYSGLMPEIYKLISQKTGYKFNYINISTINGQERMAKNCQAEIISAYIQDDIDIKYLKMPQHILTININGVEKNVNIAFSEIASEELISDISNALSEISAEKKLFIISSLTAKNGINRTHIVWLYILSGVVLILLVTGVIILICYLKKRKSNRQNLMIDPEYGIGNDQYFIYCFDNLISDKSKSLYYLSYIAFDYEDFNQKYGSAESKNVQRYTAQFLNTKTSAVEYIALVSEGVFTYIYQSANKTEAEKRISGVMNELNNYLSKFKNEYEELFHAGICALEENMGCSSEAAFYNAKQGYLYALRKKIKFAFCNQTIINQTQQNERIYQRIMQAIKNSEFKIYLQYIVDRNGRLFGAEAVSRWENPQEGLLSPSKYIEMMNQSDLIINHDLYIFSQVCGQIEKWKSIGADNLFISCNFTRYSITSPDFADRLIEVANRYHFNHNHLIIEITEDSLSYNPKTFRRNIDKCKSYGFLIALDDIGKGYTSLTDLYEYPIDFVKVEREIVLNSMKDRGKILLDGLVKLAHDMDIKVLCEGVETEEQNTIVLNTGCDFIQGFYYSHVLPQKEAEKYLKEHYDTIDTQKINRN